MSARLWLAVALCHAVVICGEVDSWGRDYLRANNIEQDIEVDIRPTCMGFMLISEDVLVPQNADYVDPAISRVGNVSNRICQDWIFGIAKDGESIAGMNDIDSWVRIGRFWKTGAFWQRVVEYFDNRGKFDICRRSLARVLLTDMHTKSAISRAISYLEWFQRQVGPQLPLSGVGAYFDGAGGRSGGYSVCNKSCDQGTKSPPGNDVLFASNSNRILSRFCHAPLFAQVGLIAALGFFTTGLIYLGGLCLLFVRHKNGNNWNGAIIRWGRGLIGGALLCLGLFGWWTAFLLTPSVSRCLNI